MAGPAKASSRPWRVIAEEISRELDPTKLTRLLEELNTAMDRQTIGLGRDDRNDGGNPAA